MTSTDEQPIVKRRRPILKWSLIGLGALLGLIVILLLALRFAVQSPIGRNFVEARIEAADPSGQDIEIEGLSGDLFGTFRIERLTVADENGIWLVAEDILADWKPLALRNRALRVEALEASLIHVMRRPVLVPSDRPQSEGGSMPLRAGAIETLDIGELRTDEGVLPRALSLAIEGQGRIGRDGGRTEIAVTPLDGEGDRLNADLTWSDDFRLHGTLALDGPAGGLFASLARLEEDQSLSASLDADGTLDDWTADARIAISGDTAITLDAGTENETIRFDLTAFPALHPLTRRVASTLGEELSVEGSLLRAEDEQPLLDLIARADGLQLDARGQRTQNGAYSADISLTADNPARYANADSISIDQATLDGNLVYDAGSVRFDGRLNGEGVDVPGFQARSVSGPLRLVRDDGQILVNTTLAGEGASVPGIGGKLAGAQPVLDANLLYDLSAGTLSVRELTLQGRAARLTAAGTATLQQPLGAELAGSFQIDGAAANLARPVRVNGQFQANRAGAGTTRFNTRINAANLGALPAPLSDWSDGQAVLTANGEVLSDGAVRFPSFTLRSGTLRLDGSGRLSSEQVIAASADLEAGEAGIAGASLGGLTGSAEVKGALDNLRFTTSLAAPSLTRGALAFTDIQLGADGTYADGGLAAGLTLDAGTPDGPLAARTDVALDGSDWRLSDFSADWGTLTAAADLSGSGGDLAALRGDLAVNGALPEGLPAERVDASASIAGDQLTLDATIETLSFGPASADALVLRATGTPNDVRFIIDMDGRTDLNDLSYETSLDVDGELTGLAGPAPLDLTASLSAVLGDLDLTTAEPIRFTRYADGLEASARFAALDGTLSPQITTRGETRLQLEGEGLRIAPLLLIAGRPPLTGAMDISVDFRETEGGLAGPLRADLEAISRPGSELGPVDLYVEGDLQPSLFDVTVRAVDSEILEATIDAEVPVNTSPSLPFITPVQGAQVPFNARMDGQIEAIAALLVPPQMVLEGLIDLDLSGSLPTLDQSFEGRLALREGVFEHGDLGLVMNQITATATLGDGTVTLEHFDARGRSGGSLSGNGAMAIDGSANSDLELTADRLVVTERAEGSATVSGSMTVNQQPDLLEILGDLTVDEGAINIENLPSGGPPTLDVSFDQPEEEETDEERQAATRLDISLNAPGRVDVSGRGVNAELGLDADITGSLGSPVITGEARIVRGRFDLLGKRFQFADSTVRLAEDTGDSRLSISARHEARDDITAILNVTGTIDRPEIELTSEPVLPEDEVLSRVLFGRSPTQLTALETARLAAALAQLSGGGGFDLLGGIEQALGLDTFDVGSASSGGVQVTSGKYLTDNVYLEVRSGAAGAPGVAIEWEPIENIEVEAATSTEEGQQLSVQWKRDFDDGMFSGGSAEESAPADSTPDAQPDADPGLPDADSAAGDGFATADDTAVDDGAASQPD